MLSGRAERSIAFGRDGIGSGDEGASIEETLVLLNRVIAAAVTSIVVTDPRLPDDPIVYHNPAFSRISGYDSSEIIGHNCRFLQGPETDREVVDQIRDALRQRQPIHVVLLNYRKDGTPFWNELAISPVFDSDGQLTHFVGVQNDVTRRTEAERERDALLQQHQRIAETLQRALLLTPPDTFHGLEVSTQYEPALDEAQFGGDFFDVFALGDNRVALLVGDVTGKGLTAAQHTAEVKYAVRVLLREYNDPTAALKRLNNFLMEGQRLDDRDRYALVCVSLAVVDTETGEVFVTAAGMESPFVVRRDGKQAEEISVGGMLLGMDVGAEYREVTVQLDEGDYLVMATDGITEARAQTGAFFGYDGLMEITRSLAQERVPLQQIGPAIVEKVRKFAGGRQHDDVCLMIVRRRNSREPGQVIA